MIGARLALTAAALLSAAGCAAPMARSDWFPVASLSGAGEEIPPAFRGRWAPDGCADPARDGLVVAYSQWVDLPGTSGQLYQIRPTGRDREMKLETWHEDDDLHYMLSDVWSLSRNGKRLTIGAGASATVYLRCP